MNDKTEIIDKLLSYKELVNNWDNEGALAPTQNSISNAINFIERLPIILTMPKPVLFASGDVVFYWENISIYCEIGFDNTNTYYVYANREGHDLIHLNTVPITKDLPTSVLHLLILYTQTQRIEEI